MAFEEITEIICALALASPVILFLWGVIYYGFLCDYVYTYREKKARQRYPKYFILLDRRNSIIHHELEQASEAERTTTKSIDTIIKEMPYTPLEDTAAKQMEAELLKKERIKAHEEVVKYRAMVEGLDIQMKSIREDNKILTKLYDMTH